MENERERRSLHIISRVDSDIFTYLKHRNIYLIAFVILNIPPQPNCKSQKNKASCLERTDRQIGSTTRRNPFCFFVPPSNWSASALCSRASKCLTCKFRSAAGSWSLWTLQWCWKDRTLGRSEILVNVELKFLFAVSK